MTAINTNVGALLASAQARTVQKDMATASMRLASGLRVNTAADDAAGLAVYNKMNSQIRGLSTALRNTSDGVSLLQTAMKGIDTSLNITQRMRELSVQSHNGVYTDSDRQNAQTEITSLLAELDKIAKQTKFNDIHLLDGSYENQMRVGNTNPEIVDVTIAGMGINKNIQTDAYATGSSVQILRPIEYATGASTFGTPNISRGQGVSAPDFLTSVTAGQITSAFDPTPNATASGSSSPAFLATTGATGTSSFDLPSQTSATGSTTAVFDATSAASIRSGSTFSSTSVITSTPAFQNGDFSDTTTTVNGNVVSIPGWDIHLERVDLGPTRNTAYTTQIGGFDTPDDPTPTPPNSGGDSVNTSGTPTFNYGFGSDGVTLGQNGFNFASGAGYGVLHGPYIISQAAVSLETNDSVSFEWMASGAGDDYDVFAYLLDEDTGNTIVMLDDTGGSGSGTVSTTVTADGNYKFVFMSGTYDASGGRWAGAEFSIDNVGITQANPPPANVFTADVSVEAVESDSVTIASSLLSSLQDSVTADSGGTFSILSSSPDASSFSINASTGDVTSTGPLRRSTQASYEFDIRYMGPGGRNHTETVTLNLTPHDEANTTLSVKEATTVEVLRSNLTSLDDFVSVHGTGGTYSLATNSADPGDYLQFSIDGNGRITSNSHLDFSTETRFDFDVLYTATSGAQFTNHVTLNLLDTLASTATLTSEEADQITISAATLASTADFAGRDTGTGGSYSIAATGPDYALFSVDSSGNVTGTGAFRRATKTQYEFDLVYRSSGGDEHVEAVTIDLSRFLQADASLSVHEADQIIIERSSLSHLDDFASDDSYGGTYRLETNSADPADYTQFQIDTNGRITSNTGLDFSVESNFDFNVVYRATDGTEFTSRVDLSLTDTLTSTATASAEEADQILLNASSLTATADFVSRDAGTGSYSIAASGPDYTMFSVDSSGLVTGTGPFRKSSKPSYQFDLNYHASTGDTHTERVTVNMNRFLQSDTVVTAAEANVVNISVDEFSHLYDFVTDVSMLGAFHLTGTDASLFEVNSVGDVTSRMALEYDTQDQYSFSLVFTATDGRVFTDSVTLNLTDTYTANTSMTAEEATQIIVSSSQLSSLNAYAVKDGNAGSFSIDNPSGHGGLFTIASDGTLTAKQEIRMADYPTLSVDVRYNAVTIPDFVETITIQTTPTTYDHTRSSFTSNEAKEVIIIPQLNPYIKAYAAADNYQGQFEVAQSNLTSSLDYHFFDIDNEGTITSSSAIDYEGGQTEFEVKILYHHSSGTKRFTDFMRLDVTNDARDDYNLALEDIDISTVNGARDANLLLDEAIIRISQNEARLGAIQNRFTHNLENLNMAVLMTERASGRIMDADYAEETAQLVKSQLLSDAANTMLVNAKTAKDNLLLLIQTP